MDLFVLTAAVSQYQNLTISYNSDDNDSHINTYTHTYVKKHEKYSYIVRKGYFFKSYKKQKKRLTMNEPHDDDS